MNIQERLARVRFFKVIPDLSGLKKNEKEALVCCVQASEVMTNIFLRQVAPGNLRIFEVLKKRSDQEGIDLFKYFNIHGSPWDAFDHDKPFLPGVGEKPKFGSLYPPGLTKEEWDAWLKTSPKDREIFESNYTVIRRRNNGLVAVPYSEEYVNRLAEAARYLRTAASYLSQGSLHSFLKLRADAFLSNDYFDSDMAWVDTNGSPFEVTIGPYEVYIDELFGLKAAFEAFVALPDKDATAALEKFTPLVPDFDVMLSQEFNFRPKGTVVPLEVVAEVMRGGEALSTSFVAYNLPNDRRIHDLKGSKKVFSRTMMEAKFNTISAPIAERIFTPDIASKCLFNNRLLFVLGHELAHGLGPSKVIVDGREIPFGVALKDLHSFFEEAKADMLGARILDYFRHRGLIDDNTLLGILSIEVLSFFHGWKHGFTESHARANIVEYNWLKTANAIYYDSARKKIEIDFERCVDAMSRLSNELLKLQILGDYDQAKAFAEHWGAIPKELPSIIESLDDIPTAVYPIYELNL